LIAIFPLVLIPIYLVPLSTAATSRVGGEAARLVSEHEQNRDGLSAKSSTITPVMVARPEQERSKEQEVEEPATLKSASPKHQSMRRRQSQRARN
jgi:hypothetical protein